MSSSIRSRSERWWCSVLVVALFALAPRPAVGAELTDEAKAQARVKFSEGNAAYEQGDFREALKSFEAAYRLAPLPGFLFNVAQCHRQLGDFAQRRLLLPALPLALREGARQRGDGEGPHRGDGLQCPAADREPLRVQ